MKIYAFMITLIISEISLGSYFTAIGIGFWSYPKTFQKNDLDQNIARHFNSLSLPKQKSLIKAAHDLYPFFKELGSYHIAKKDLQQHYITIKPNKPVVFSDFCKLTSSNPSLVFSSIEISINISKIDPNFILTAIPSSIPFYWDPNSKKLRFYNISIEKIKSLLSVLTSSTYLSEFTIKEDIPAPKDWRMEPFLKDFHELSKKRSSLLKQKEM